MNNKISIADFFTSTRESNSEAKKLVESFLNSDKAFCVINTKANTEIEKLEALKELSKTDKSILMLNSEAEHLQIGSLYNVCKMLKFDYKGKIKAFSIENEQVNKKGLILIKK